MPSRRVALVAFASLVIGVLVAAAVSPQVAEAKRATATQVRAGTAESVIGRVKGAAKGRTRVKVKQLGAGVVSSDVVRVEQRGAFEAGYESLAPGTYRARARYMGSRVARPSRSKPRLFEVEEPGDEPVEEPVEEEPVAEPGDEPVEEEPGDDPVEEERGDEPVEEDPVEEEPVEEGPVEDPVDDPVEEEPVEDPVEEEPEGSCPLPGPQDVQGIESFELPGCPILASDTAAVADARDLWGRIDCGRTTAEDPTRAKVLSSGGDVHPLADGTEQGDDSYRRLTTIDGDDHWGERCELGKHDHRYGSGGGEGTFQLYNEGDRRVTMVSLRFPGSFPLMTPMWQTVLQMKQTAPSAGSGGGPMIEVQLREGKFWLGNEHSDLWQAAAPRTGAWTRIAFDVRYSQDPGVGFIRMYVDSNGDGDAADAGERSPTFHTATLKREIAGGTDDGIAPGESIPSALRTGIYHNPDVACPPPGGCSVEVDNVQVLGTS